MSSQYRVAVLLCGEYRQWQRAAPYNFRFFEHHFENVDWFFATWSKHGQTRWCGIDLVNFDSEVLDNDIIATFTDKNLVNYKILPMGMMPSYNMSFYHRALLAKTCNILKRRYELDNDFIYDQVIEMRPDLYLPLETYDIAICKEFQFTMPMMCAFNDIPWCGDNAFQTTSFTNDIMTSRVSYNKIDNFNRFTGISEMSNWSPGTCVSTSTFDVHWLLSDFIMHRRLIFIDNPLPQVPIRANFPADDLDNHSMVSLHKFNREFTDSK